MKKGSTAAAQPLSQFSRQKLTMGLDLGDRFSYYCVLDENGELVRQQKIPTTAKGLQAAVDKYRLVISENAIFRQLHDLDGFVKLSRQHNSGKFGLK